MSELAPQQAREDRMRTLVNRCDVHNFSHAGFTGVSKFGGEMAFLEFAEPGALGDLARATVALLVWYYVALFTQSYAKIALVQQQRQEQFGLLSYRSVNYTDPAVARLKYGVPHDSPIALTADRTAGNLSEQLVPFLASAWLRALLVPGAAASSGRLCYAYLVSRMVYPFAFYAGHPLLQLSTQPGYLIVWGQLADVYMFHAGDPPTWWSAARTEVAITPRRPSDDHDSFQA